MAMNKVKQGSQMYPWVTHTWNVIKGKCPHDCSYCYMKRYPQKPLRFDEKELSTDLGSGNFIFVGSSCDMWAGEVDSKQISRILNCCILHGHNQYLFQSKNPARFMDFIIPPRSILGTTIESNFNLLDSCKAPSTFERYQAMVRLKPPKMVSIEPIMNFSLGDMVYWIQEIQPEFVSIGSDSGNNHLPEPEPAKVKALISELQKITTVKIKDNLKRLLPVTPQGERE